jgi:hypothetical protein
MGNAGMSATRWFAFLPQQDEQPAVAEALPLTGEIAELVAQFPVAGDIDNGPSCDRS